MMNYFVAGAMLTQAVHGLVPLPKSTTLSFNQRARKLLESPGNLEACGAEFDQCGGRGYDGPTCCTEGLQCLETNEWYFSCKQSGPEPSDDDTAEDDEYAVFPEEFASAFLSADSPADGPAAFPDAYDADFYADAPDSYDDLLAEVPAEFLAAGLPGTDDTSADVTKKEEEDEDHYADGHTHDDEEEDEAGGDEDEDEIPAESPVEVTTVEATTEDSEDGVDLFVEEETGTEASAGSTTGAGEYNLCFEGDSKTFGPSVDEREFKDQGSAVTITQAGTCSWEEYAGGFDGYPSPEIGDGHEKGMDLAIERMFPGDFDKQTSFLQAMIAIAQPIDLDHPQDVARADGGERMRNIGKLNDACSSLITVSCGTP